jgi:hypothetical protein
MVLLLLRMMMWTLTLAERKKQIQKIIKNLSIHGTWFGEVLIGNNGEPLCINDFEFC